MTISEKLSTLRVEMAAADCNGVLLMTSDPHCSEYMPDAYQSVAWFSGFTGENSTLVITSTESALWADGRFFVQAANQLAGSEIQLMRMGEPGVPTVAAYVADKLAGGTLALDGRCVPCATAATLEEALAPTGGKLKSIDLVSPIWNDGRPALPATPCFILEEQYSGLSSAAKLAQVRLALNKTGADALAVARLDCVAWLLNLRASDVLCTPYALAFAAVTPDDCTLFIDDSRMEADVKANLSRNGVEIAPYEAVYGWAAHCTDHYTLRMDAAGTNFALATALRENPCLTVQEGADPILLLKAVKNDVELASTREAHIKDAVAMVRFEIELEKRLAAGEQLTELDADEMMQRYRSAQDGFLSLSFETIAAWGPNAAMMHYHATPAQFSDIQPHGFLLVDCGGTYMDGTTDITRTYPVGPLTRQEKEFYTWTLQGHIDMAKAVWLDYNTGAQLDVLAREPLWRNLINYRCGTGHGVAHVGAVHEGPQQLRPVSDVKLVPGMILTDEPGVYETDLVGIRIENELVVTEHATNQYGRFLAFDSLTLVPYDLSPVLPELLTADEKNWLNAYHARVYEALAPRLTDAEAAWLQAKTQPLA